MFIKKVFSTIFYGALGAAGWMVGTKLFETLSDPYERTKLKKKIMDVRDAITK